VCVCVCVCVCNMVTLEFAQKQKPKTSKQRCYVSCSLFVKVGYNIWVHVNILCDVHTTRKLPNTFLRILNQYDVYIRGIIR
jgi:hypothetical protein